MAQELSNDSRIKNFRDYLRIRSVQPNINYDECITFLRARAEEIGLSVQVFEPVAKKPILVMTWVGTEPELPSILLNSHMDVVPVFEKSWTHPPFEAYMDDEGKIYARGAQDMKSVAIQYIEAVRQLKANGTRLKRTVHLSFVPDEEIGGVKGMAEFVKTDDFKKLNVGFTLDEGLANPGEDFIVFYGERSVWHVDFHCSGKSGHGSLLLPNTAGEKIRYIINKLMDLREVEKNKLEGTELTVGDVTTVNLTRMKGGVQPNVVPEVLSVTFDIRLALSVKHDEFSNMLEQWASEAGEGVRVEYVQKHTHVNPTVIDDSNAFWVAFKNATEQLKMKIKTRVFPGGTDSHYIREIGIPALGFSPMNRTPVQLHEHNESLSAEVFLKGIDIYTNLIPAIANA